MGRMQGGSGCGRNWSWCVECFFLIMPFAIVLYDMQRGSLALSDLLVNITFKDVTKKSGLFLFGRRTPLATILHPHHLQNTCKWESVTQCTKMDPLLSVLTTATFFTPVSNLPRHTSLIVLLILIKSYSWGIQSLLHTMVKSDFRCDNSVLSFFSF